MKNFIRLQFVLPLIAVLGFFFYWLFSYYMTHDLVWDEIVSLKNFVLVDVQTTVTHYPDVNNHVFFNLLNNFYCQVVGVDNVHQAMGEQALMRIYTLVITLLSLFFVFRSGQKFLNLNAGFMSAMILVTTIPFLNFTMQLRGYTMSMSFMAMLIYFLWSQERKSSIVSSFMIVFSAFGILYAIPSNIYFVLSLVIYYVIVWILDARKKQIKQELSFIDSWVKNNKFFILVFLGLGSILAFLAYLPILDLILNERHLQQLKGKSFYEHTLTKVIPFVLHYILSYRFLFIIPFFIVVSVLIGKSRKKSLNEEDKKMIFLIAIILLSFGISLARGDRPHQRTFAPLAVVISLLLGGSTSYVFNSIKALKGKELISFFIVFVYCLGSFVFCDNLIQKTLRKNIIQGKKVYNMFYNFYQSREYGMKNLDILIQDAQSTGHPILMAKEIDRVAEGEYLLKNNLNYLSTVWARQSKAENESGWEYQVLIEIGQDDQIGYQRIGYPPRIGESESMFVPLFNFAYQKGLLNKQNPTCYVLTRAPKWFEEVMRKGLPNMKFRKLNMKMNYHNIYLISMKGS